MKFAGALLAAVVAIGGDAFAETPVDREVARLEHLAESIDPADLPEPVRGGIDAYRAALRKAKNASAEDYRLYLLRDPFVGIETLAFVAHEKGAGASVEAFRALWDANRKRFTAPAEGPRGTLLQRGLAESAATRAERLFGASLPYAKASEPWSGVYYLGEAAANLRFRDFLSFGPDHAVERTPRRRAIEAQLDQLERATLSFFAGDIMNANLIAVSVRLKEARELLAAGRLSGATLLAVEARAALSRRGGPRGSYPPKAAAPPGSVLAFLRGWSEAEQEPMRGALAGEVASFYGALFAPPGTPSRVENARVTVTLVRWPYT